MTNQTCFKHNGWWVYSKIIEKKEYIVWGSKEKVPSLLGWRYHSEDIYFQFGGTRKEAIDKLIIELDEVDEMVK